MERSKATSQLERIVQAIEAGKFPAPVKELHVFGSYARGAPNPGDLDLILIHEPPAPELINHLKAEIVEKYGENTFYWPRGTWPERKFEILMRKVMRRPGEKMDILLAKSLHDALDGRKNIADSERVMIWSESDRDWKGKLDSIKVDNTKGRYERGHFANLKLFQGDLPTMERISEAIAEGVLNLTRIDADAMTPNLNSVYQHWCDWWIECKVMGKESLKLLPYGMWWVQQQRGQMWKRPHSPRPQNTLYSDDWKYAAYFGRPSLYAVYSLGGKEHVNKRICFIPHFKRGHKNELFVFERGDKFSQKRWDAIMDRRRD